MKKWYKKAIIACIGLFSLSLTAHAQSAERKWGLGFNVGARDSQTDVGNQILFQGFDNPYFVWGTYLGRYLNSSFDLTGNVNGGMLGYRYSGHQYGKFTAKAIDASLMIKYKFNNGYFLKEDAFFAPYLTAGIGGYQAWDIINEGYVPQQQVDNMTVLDIPFGIGFKFRLSETTSINLQSIYHYGFTDELDNIKNVNSDNDGWLHTSLGLGFNLGKSKPKDEDGDGVIDKIDKCPGTRPTFKVDMFGCDLDSDGDGIADSEDNCPDEAGSARLSGCPDKDGDGIIDSRDRCPDVAGLEKFNGCPDTDGDGIQDSEDKCPNVAGIAAFAGCPDTDGDGVEDALDKCPNAAGKPEMAGCPDTDGDGVNDADDKCPTLAGTIENSGCPVVNQAVQKRIAAAAKQINFETGSDVLTQASYKSLDVIVAGLVADSALKADINGHTDNVGDVVKNKELSKKRAAAVQKYLVSKGVGVSRLKSEGFGSEQPIADNKTVAGKAKNRRVEVKFHYD